MGLEPEDGAFQAINPSIAAYAFQDVSPDGYGFEAISQKIFACQLDPFEGLFSGVEPEVLGHAIRLQEVRPELDGTWSRSGYTRKPLDIIFNQSGEFQGVGHDDPWSKSGPEIFSAEQSLFVVSEWRRELLQMYHHSEGPIHSAIEKILLAHRIAFDTQPIFGQVGFAVGAESFSAEEPRVWLHTKDDYSHLTLIDADTAIIRFTPDPAAVDSLQITSQGIRIERPVTHDFELTCKKLPAADCVTFTVSHSPRPVEDKFSERHTALSECKILWRFAGVPQLTLEPMPEEMTENAYRAQIERILRTYPISLRVTSTEREAILHAEISLGYSAHPLDEPQPPSVRLSSPNAVIESVLIESKTGQELGTSYAELSPRGYAMIHLNGSQSSYITNRGVYLCLELGKQDPAPQLFYPNGEDFVLFDIAAETSDLPHAVVLTCSEREFGSIVCKVTQNTLSLTINHSDGTYEAGLNRKEFDQRYPHFLEILSQSAQEVLGDVPAIKGLKFSPQSIVLLHDSASPDYLPLSEWRFESDFGPDKSGKFPEPVLDSEQTLRGSPLQLWLSDPREKLSRRDDPFEERIELKAASFEILMNGGFQVATPQFVDGLALAARLGWVCQKPTYVGPLIRGVSVIDGKLVDSWDAPDDATRYVITLSLSEFELPAFYCAEYGTVSSTSLFALEHKGAINGDDIEIMQMCRLESSQRVEVDQIPEISREELHTYLTDRMQREYRQMGMGNFRLGGVSRVVYDLSDIRKLAEEHRLYMPVGGMSDLGIEPKW